MSPRNATRYEWDDLPPGAFQAERLILASEPTSYKMDFWRALKQVSTEEKLFLCFISRSRSQVWNIDTSGDDDIFVMPDHRGQAASLLLRLLRKGRFKSVMVPGWSEPLAKLALVYGRIAGLPTLVETDTPHNPLSPWLKRAVKQATYPFLLRLPNHFLPFGTRQKSYLHRFGVTDNRITIARTTVDTGKISRAHHATVDQRDELRRRFGFDKDAVLFLAVGRLEPYKGIHALLESGAEILRSSTQAHILITGEGTMRPEVERSAAKFARMHYLGWSNFAELVDLYSISDVFIHLPLFEPWGLVINEAMAAGLPLIVSNRTGCLDDLVRVGQNAFTVDPHNIDQISKAAITLVAAPQLRRRMSQASLTIIADWSIERYAATVIGAWSRLCP